MRRYIYLLILIISGCSSSEPRKVFEERTGLSITDSISSIETTDNYEFREGEFSIVFKTTESQIKSWLEKNPPWNDIKWHKGKIPYEIGVAVKFNFPETVSLASYDNGKSDYIGNENLVKLLNDSTNYYSYAEDCCSDNKNLRFHDGRFLILQPRTRMVYYQVWNY